MNTSLGESITRRRQELLGLQDRRERMGQDLLEERLLGICQILEKRIASIEKLIAQGSPKRAVASGEPGTDGTNVASDLDEMLPDLNLTGASVVQGTNSQAEPPSERPPEQEGRPQASHALTGRIEDGMISDILQMISANAKTGIFKIVDNEKQIDLFFRDGELYHALADDMQGQSAFFAAMALEVGSFFFEGTEELPEEKTIDGNTQFMILEALRQIDEQRGGS